MEGGSGMREKRENLVEARGKMTCMVSEDRQEVGYRLVRVPRIEFGTGVLITHK